MTQFPQNPLPYQPPQPNPRPTSVTVIAIFVIVLSSLGVLSPCALIPYFVDFGQLQDPMQRALYENEPAKWATVASTLIWFILSIVNLTAAIRALKLAATARRTLVTVAIVQLVMIVINSVVNFTMVYPAMFSGIGNDPAMKAGYMFAMVFGVIGVLISCVLPSLTIYFMTRPHVIAAFENRQP